jgi:hypothetical protein
VRDAIQAPPHLFNLLHFLFHHGLELHITPHMLTLFLLLDLDSRLEVPHHLHRIQVMPLCLL